MPHGESIAHATSSYIGADRRQARAGARQSIRFAELCALAGALAFIGVALPTLLSGLSTSTDAIHAQAALRTTWSMLFLCAGVIRLVRWRLTGETRTGLLGAAMFSFAVVSAPTAALAPLIHNTPRDAMLSPVTRTVALTVFLVALTRSFRSEPVNARVQPIRTMVRMLLGAGGVLATVIGASALGGPIALTGPAWFFVGALQACVCAALATTALLRGARASDASYTWIGLGLLLVTGAQFLHSLAFVGPRSFAFFSTCLLVIAAGIALANSAADLSLVFSADGNRMLSLSGALQEAEQMLTDEEREQEERLHDARSVIAALKAASITLDRYDERLDTAVKHSLRSSLVSELGRLERVIDGRRREPLQVFRLDVALGPVLTAERENGLVITNKLGSVKALGRPLELATVVQNLLVNARRYAPGSIVRIAATSSAGNVQIVVEDRGPGVDPTQHELIFQRGYRCCPDDDAAGSGLGLFLARRLMREQEGEIVLRERPGGGASFVLSLRAASAAEHAQNGVQVGDAVNGAKHRLTDERDRPLLASLPRQRDDHATSGSVIDLVGDDKVHYPARWRNRRHLQPAQREVTADGVG